MIIPPKNKYTLKLKTQKKSFIPLADKKLQKLIFVFFRIIDPHSQKQRRKSSRLSARGDGTTGPSEAGDTLDNQSQARYNNHLNTEHLNTGFI